MDLKCQGTPETRNQGFADLIIYGVKGFQPDVDSSVYDSPFIFENQKMVIQTDLDLNGHSILNQSPKPKFLISGFYNRIKSKTFVLFHDQQSTFTLLPVNCRLVKVVLYMVDVLDPSPAVNIKIQHRVGNQTVSGSQHHIQSYDFNLKIPDATPLFVKLFTDDKVTKCFFNLYFEET